MSHGSQQLRQFRIAVRDGATLEEACAATDHVITPAEGKIYLEWDRKNPPPPEAYQLLAPTRKDADMATAAKKEDGEGAGITGEYKRPDAKGAIKIYREEIAGKLEHIATIKGDLSDPHKRIKDECNFPKTILNLLMKLEDLEDAKRDHWLLALNGGLAELKIGMPRDLVTIANGEDGGSVVPIGEGRKPQLATLPMGVPSDGTEDDLAKAGEDDFDEATDEELAQQEGRKAAALKKGSISSIKSPEAATTE